MDTAMRVSRTLSAYVGRQFLFWFLVVIMALAAIIILFDTLELFRRTSDQPNATVGILFTMSFFKMPSIIEKAVPFATLFGAMFAFWRLNRNHEIVIARSAGVSVWQFLFPVVLLAVLIGALKVTVFNPLVSAMLLRYEQLEAKYIRGSSSLAAVSSEGLWLRQNTKAGHYFMHAQDVSPRRMELTSVIIFMMRDNDTFTRRIDAPVALLRPGYWLLRDVTISQPDTPTRRAPTHRIVTDLTTENIQDSFAPPETLSFWELPGFIAILEEAGFSGLRHRMHFHTLLATPVLLSAMVLLAATFSFRLIRRGGTGLMIACGIATGFLVYFVSDIVSALGVSARLPVLLAAWCPAIVSCLLGVSMLFHLEDG